MSKLSDPADKAILNALQQIPLVRMPFLEIAKGLGVSEQDILARISRLSTPPVSIIRQISAIFDSRSLGYQTTLVACKIPESLLDKAVSVINAHPGVSHNYLRNHTYNLWYTLAVPSESKIGLEKTVQILHDQSGARVTRMLPTLKMYKIGVKFDFGDFHSEPGVKEAGEEIASPLTDREKRFVRILQSNLPLEPMPFDRLAREGNVDPDELIAAAVGFKQQKRMRRFAAVIRHRNAGFVANAMGVWAVPSSQIEAFGTMAAKMSCVSHCYHRPVYEDWPYSMFTMIHGKSAEECEGALARLSKETRIGEYAALYSTREFKKSRVKYFEPDITDWETANHD